MAAPIPTLNECLYTTGEPVLSASATSSSTLVSARPTRVRAIQYVAGASAGTVVLKDGGSSGTALITINTPASAAETQVINIPGSGVQFGTDVYVTLTQATGVTIFYA